MLVSPEMLRNCSRAPEKETLWGVPENSQSQHPECLHMWLCPGHRSCKTVHWGELNLNALTQVFSMWEMEGCRHVCVKRHFLQYMPYLMVDSSGHWRLKWILEDLLTTIKEDVTLHQTKPSTLLCWQLPSEWRWWLVNQKLFCACEGGLLCKGKVEGGVHSGQGPWPQHRAYMGLWVCGRRTRMVDEKAPQEAGTWRLSSVYPVNDKISLSK